MSTHRDDGIVVRQLPAVVLPGVTIVVSPPPIQLVDLIFHQPIPDVCEPCGACANCCPDALDSYERELVRKILAGIARAGERYGRNRIVAMLVGDTSDLPAPLTGLSTTGMLRHESADALHDWISGCVSAGLVSVSNDRYRTLSLTAEGRQAMRGQLQPLKVPRRIPLRSRLWSSNDDDDDQHDELHLLRRDLWTRHSYGPDYRR